MALLLTAGLVWVCAAVPVGVLLGRSVRLADERAGDAFGIDGVERYLRETAATRRS